MQHQLSIVIPVYDNWWLTERCLRELERVRFSTQVSFEVIVVDNASGDETPQAIAAFPSVRHERLASNRNFAGACNAGVRLADAPIVLLLNNDAYPLGDALTPLVRPFTRAEVVIAGGALLYEDGVTQAAGLVLLRNAHWHYSFRNLPEGTEQSVQARDALGVSGAAMAVRREWFLQTGGFDETFRNGFEDVDLCMRAVTQKRNIVYVPSARFAHYEGATAGRFDREAENERRFYRTWSSRLARLPRVERGDVGAISLQMSRSRDPLLEAAAQDLEDALASFGHPVVRTPVTGWQKRFDRRFRNCATIGWFADVAPEPGVVIERTGAIPTIRTQGAVDVRVPWLPCASDDRVAAANIVPAASGSVGRIALAGSDEAIAVLALGDLGFDVVRVTPELLLSRGERIECAAVVHAGLTDDSAFGTVLLARAGIPAVVVDRTELRALFAPDVAVYADANRLRSQIAALVADSHERTRLGLRVAADAKRRFSPRRSAIRVVDLLCAARFGFEKPATALANAPIPLR